MIHPKLKQLANTLIEIELGPLTLYFSYRTCIAFHVMGKGHVLRENAWGPTTGKHLNLISRTAPRFSRVDFETQLQIALREHAADILTADAFTSPENA